MNKDGPEISQFCADFRKIWPNSFVGAPLGLVPPEGWRPLLLVLYSHGVIQYTV